MTTTDTNTNTATVAAVSALRAQLMLLLADLRLREDRNDESFAAALNDHALTRALAPAGGWQPLNARHLVLALGLYRRPGRRELDEVGAPVDVALPARAPLITTCSSPCDRRIGVLDQPGCKASRRIEIMVEATAKQWSLTYDAQDRLLASFAAGLRGHQACSYSYDGSGNRPGRELLRQADRVRLRVCFIQRAHRP